MKGGVAVCHPTCTPTLPFKVNDICPSHPPVWQIRIQLQKNSLKT